VDATGLRRLVPVHGPFASIYFDGTHDTENAAKLLELRWRELRADLAEQGATERQLGTLDAALAQSEPPVGRAGRAIVASPESVLLDQVLSRPPARAQARLSHLPYLVPLLEYGESPPAHVVTVADRVGADITAIDTRGEIVDARTVEGSEHHVHKVRGAGWSHRNVQAHAEELAKQNIDKAAEHVAEMARRIGAALVLVAGESQARKALLEALPQHVRKQATEVEGAGGRHPGSGHDQLDEKVDEELARAIDQRRDEVAERFRAALGQPTGLAVQGLQATTTALREHNVETLLVSQPADADVVTGPDTTQLSLQPDELTALGVESIEARHADEAVIMAAIAEGAELVHMGERLDLTEGFGALLRHD
jgi:hypothetical protein